MNHPHEQQAAAMARAGELPDGEQLRECINSGQVSAAQVVAHAENGELSMSMFASREDYDKAVARQGAETCVQLCWARHALYLVRNKLRSIGIQKDDTAMVNLAAAENAIDAALKADYATAALAAERAEVARLREALTLAVRQNEHDMVMTGEELRICRAALTAPGEKK